MFYAFSKDKRNNMGHSANSIVRNATVVLLVLFVAFVLQYHVLMNMHEKTANL